MDNIDEKIKEALGELDLRISTYGGGMYSANPDGFRVELFYKDELLTTDYLDGYDIKEVIDE